MNEYGEQPYKVTLQLIMLMSTTSLQNIVFHIAICIFAGSLSSTELAKQEAFAAQLLSIGEGRERQNAQGRILVPDTWVMPTHDPAHLIDKVFGTDPMLLTDSRHIKGKAILAARHEEVNLLNEAIMARILKQVSPKFSLRYI